MESLEPKLHTGAIGNTEGKSEKATCEADRKRERVGYGTYGYLALVRVVYLPINWSSSADSQAVARLRPDGN
jgi:hypothetical protein